jgi:hypothetical protein
MESFLNQMALLTGSKKKHWTLPRDPLQNIYTSFRENVRIRYLSNVLKDGAESVSGMKWRTERFDPSKNIFPGFLPQIIMDI